MISILFITVSLGLTITQLNSPPSAIEDVIVEIYHVAEDENLMDMNGQSLPPGTITYRIFIDMKEGYALQAMYGLKDHPLIFKTTTQFYNNIDWGSTTGNKVIDRRMDRYGVALDSWLTMGGATRQHMGVPLSLDTDGSILAYPDLQDADGLLSGYEVPSPIEYGIDLHVFDEADNTGLFTTEDGALAVLGGLKGTNEKNYILVAQLTTDGQLSFELNLQVSNPHCETENYVARNPINNEIKADCLAYPIQ
jgi:hypothetical protein